MTDRACVTTEFTYYKADLGTLGMTKYNLQRVKLVRESLGVVTTRCRTRVNRLPRLRST
jgi:hypothetical protein